MENEINVMQVLRVPPLGKIEVRVGERRFQHISEVEEPAMKQRLMAAIGELVVFADGYEALESAGLAPPLAIEVAESGQEVSESIEKRQAEFLSSVELERDVMYLTDAESSGSVHPVGTRPTDRTGDTGPLSIAGQINPLIQKHVAANPNLAGRTIELEQDAAGTLTIEVDGKYYERPDQIEEPEVRRAIQAALKEWDRT